MDGKSYSMKIWRFLAIALAMLLPAVAGVGVASAQEEANRTAIDQDMIVKVGEVVEGNAGVTNGSISVLGEVRGNVVVVQGNAQINGKVGGDVSVANGDVVLGPHCEVVGNVLVMGGKIKRDPAALVGGKASVLDVPIPGVNSAFPFSGSAGAGNASGPHTVAKDLSNSVGRVAGLILWMAVGLLILAFVLAFALAAPLRLGVSGDTLEAAPGPSIAVGVISALLLTPVIGFVSVALAATVVGIALIPVVGVAALVALLYGLSTISLWLGKRLYESMWHGQFHPVLGLQRLVVESLLGAAVILSAALLPSLLLPGWIGLLLWGLVYFAACIGLGAGIMSRFGTLAPPARRLVTQ